MDLADTFPMACNWEFEESHTKASFSDASITNFDPQPINLAEISKEAECSPHIFTEVFNKAADKYLFVVMSKTFSCIKNSKAKGFFIGSYIFITSVKWPISCPCELSPQPITSTPWPQSNKLLGQTSCRAM